MRMKKVETPSTTYELLYWVNLLRENNKDMGLFEAKNLALQLLQIRDTPLYKLVFDE
jgi:hypothetical protein